MSLFTEKEKNLLIDKAFQRLWEKFWGLAAMPLNTAVKTVLFSGQIAWMPLNSWVYLTS